MRGRLRCRALPERSECRRTQVRRDRLDIRRRPGVCSRRREGRFSNAIAPSRGVVFIRDDPADKNEVPLIGRYVIRKEYPLAKLGQHQLCHCLKICFLHRDVIHSFEKVICVGGRGIRKQSAKIMPTNCGLMRSQYTNKGCCSISDRRFSVGQIA
jgi:hypothetical protein